MSHKKNARILGIRLDETESKTLAEIEAATTFPPVSIARAAITAVIRRWQTTHELSLPFHIITTAELKKQTAPSPVKTGAALYPFPSDSSELKVADSAAASAPPHSMLSA